MLGTIINTLAIILGSLVGLFIKGGISNKISDTIMKGIALCVFYIGVSGSLKGENTLITIICIAVGSLIGEYIDIDKRLKSLGNFIELKVSSKTKISSSLETSKFSISKAFVSSSLLFCVGAMAIVGSLESGLLKDYDTLLAKSVLDGISAIIFSATLGIGVIFSSIAVFIYQGTITLCASFLSSLLSQAVITSMTAIGSLLIIGLSFDMLGISKIKVSNMLPSVFLPILLGLFGLI